MKLNHIKLFESFDSGKIDVDATLKNLIGNRSGHISLIPGLKKILTALNESGVDFKVKQDGSSTKITNTNNESSIYFFSSSTISWHEPTFTVRLTMKDSKVMDVFKSAENKNWFNENGEQLANSMIRGYNNDALKFWPNRSNEGGGGSPWTPDFTSEESMKAAWADYAKAWLEKHEGKKQKMYLTGLEVIKPNMGKDPVNILDANETLVNEVMNHPYWTSISSDLTDIEANRKLLNKLADQKIPLVDRMKSIVKTIKPNDVIKSHGTSNPWATTSTDRRTAVYDLGFLEDDPSDIKDAFDSISKEDWQKVASEAFGGYLISIKVVSVKLEDSEKSKSEVPDLFNQNKLQIYLEYDSTIWQN